MDEALLVGVLAGSVYFSTGLLWFFPTEELALMASAGLAANLFIYSFSLSILGFVFLSAVLLGVTRPLSRPPQSFARTVLRRFILYFVVFTTFAAGHVVWAIYDRAMPFEPRDIAVENLTRWLLRMGLIAGVSALALSLAVAAGRGRHRRPRTPGRRPLLIITGACLAYVVGSNVTGIASRLVEPGKHDEAAGEAGPIVLLGIDAASWNVMLPFINRGELPALQKMMNQGTCGYLTTHGHAMTWPSWACIATGKVTAKNGIRLPSHLSSDWRAAPVWSILSRAGRKVGVVNWLNSWPPFKVNGITISNPHPSRSDRIYCSPGFDSVRRVADSMLVASEHGADPEQGIREPAEDPEMAFLSSMHREVISTCDLDFIAYYYYRPDGVQHLNIDGNDFGGPANQLQREAGGEGTPADPILEAYRSADGFLAELMARYGSEAHYFVVSDHGARKVKTRIADFDMQRLLEEMGHLKLAEGRIDSARSTCFEAEWPTTVDRYDLVVNVPESPDSGEARAAVRQETARRIAGELRSIRVEENRRPIFRRVEVHGRSADGTGPDITAYAGLDLLQMPEQRKTFVVGGRSIDLRSFLDLHPWKGRHRTRGVILAMGPEVRHRYSGSWMMSGPYASIFRQIDGLIPGTLQIGRLLRRLHLLDESTVLDLTPTLLYLADVPVSEDMDGRVLTQLISKDLLKRRPIRTVLDHPVGDVVDRAATKSEDDAVRARLKALGYLH